MRKKAMRVQRFRGRFAQIVSVMLGLYTYSYGKPPIQDETLKGSTRVAFEVATLKVSVEGRRHSEVANGNLTMRHQTLSNLIAWAYGVDHFRIVGLAPVGGMYYDVLAKAAGPVADAEMRRMMQVLLAERLKLAVHSETRELLVTVMTVGKNGTHLQPSDGDKPSVATFEKGQFAQKSVTMTELAATLSAAGPPIVDQTGIAGRFDVSAEYARYLDPVGETTLRATRDAVCEALQSLGLKFGQKKVPLSVTVVDHVNEIPIVN